MQGVFAEYERTKIVERTRRGKLYKARMGLLVWQGPPPYGYRIVRGPKGAPTTISIDEREAPWVRKMFEWVVEESLSARQVAKRLNRLGVAPRRAACWNQGSVQVMLRNPAYTGTAYYNRHESAEPGRRRNPAAYPRNWKSSRRMRPKEEWIPVPVPALVSSERQERALEEIRTHRWRFARNTLYPYLLRTLVVCGECGRRMCAMTPRSWWPHHTRGGREWYPYYECPTHKQSPEDTGHLTKCSSRRVRADRLDEVVWRSLGEFLQRPEVLKVEIAAYAEDRRSSARGEASEEKRLVERQRQLERQRARLVDAYQAGLLEVSELRQRGERLEIEQGEIRRREEELQALKASGARVEEIYQEVEVFCARLREGMDRL
ncbi:DNA recombinase, partial [mine drainage metagenome]